MASFFGEIIQSRSRAVDEDEDELDCPTISTTNIRWSPVVRAEVLKKPDGKLPCQSLIIAIGPAASAFAQSYILTENYYVVGALFSGLEDTDINTFDQLSPTDKTCYIYRCRQIPDAFLCLCKTDVSPEQSYSFTEQLFSCISSDSPHFYMSILCSCMTSEYKSDVPVSDMNPPFLRSLKTNKFPGTPLGPYLEQPNLVSGLPAQLLTYAQMKDLKTVLYICYTDSVYPDYASIRIFHPLLQSTPIRDLIQENPRAEEALKKIVELYSVQNVMYL
ncbi:proteasome assembly chaperone 1-like [Ruditapes philippinarum]|uniref:proteasome assembly chaperone 1-like n=1 Tax=Ruditapes philippinarum TaxID=129788 RepID=UPI00295C100F|nr:proteasome assembly chaperone 1-like [Ruditapes philippinarum]